jgi:hypothetical protein
VWFDDDGIRIRARRFDESAVPSGPEFPVNVFADGTQEHADLAVRPDGS